MTKLYREILKNAWRTCIHYRFLWFFGLFAALLGNGGEYEIFFRNLDAASNYQKMSGQFEQLVQTGVLHAVVNNIASLFANHTAISLIWTLLVVIVFAFLIWMIIVSQAALIDSSANLNKGKSASLETGFKAGKSKFASLFLLNIVAKVIIYGLLMVIAVPLGYIIIAQQNQLSSNIFNVFAFVILVPLAIIVSFMIKYAIAYVVLEDKKTGEAFGLGWKLFFENWLISFEMAVILFLITFVAAAAMVLAAALIAIPVIGLTYLFILTSLPTATEAIITIGVIIAIVAIFIIGAFVGAFQWSAWTFLFQKLTKEKQLSKLVRIFHKKTA